MKFSKNRISYVKNPLARIGIGLGVVLTIVWLVIIITGIFR